ncbi:hypothetical protein C0W54_05765 [Photobacterium kishitanii]|uniref:glycosyltransferase family 25 protein n=1 Tax=Photobacterium kishitanii TaxID=318456 RepID=UPI000D164564|nr:glycosyltransferase family 25 protein [Photobacterium kishitanii]PSW62344.1 hypothetical protein C0W54_05765 [Photobacterium kishitanii]
MNIYLISIRRLRERYLHINNEIKKSKKKYKVIGVDGTEINRESYCKEFNDGQVGCALSHVEAYKEIFTSGNKSACIIEDDVILPNNIDAILNEIGSIIGEDEIIFLYNRNISTAKYSLYDQMELKNGKLVYPLSMKDVRTAAVYVIGREAAKKLYVINKNIEFIADDWHGLYSKGGFNSPRILYNKSFRIKGFQSSIGYSQDDSLTIKIAKYLLKGKAYKYIRYIRLRYILLKHESNYKYVNEYSQLARCRSNNNE